MFHRVLAIDDARWATSDPEYTLPTDVFEECLRFFKRHYNVVALDDVLAGRLPERPLLITFDDGWSDNEEYALPLLRAHGLPAVLFVVGDAVDRAQPFWQEQMITAARSGRLDAATSARLWRELGGSPPAAGPDALAPVRALIAALERADGATRARLLGSIAAVLDDGVRYMITKDQLRALAASRVTIGAHGLTHEPLTQVPDVDVELTSARRILEGALGGGAVTTISFPHGRFDERTVERARAAGYRLCFTSVPELPGPGAPVLGRVGFTTDDVTIDGRFAPELLALLLFRKPHADSRLS